MEVPFASIRAEDLVDRFDPADLIPTARALQTLSDDRTLVLDHAFRQWTLRALLREKDEEGLLQLDDLIGLSAGLLPREDVNYRPRWRAFRDLVESKRLASESKTSRRAERLRHAGVILEHLSSGPISQSELRERLGVSAQRLSQILNVMEQGGLVGRTRHGRENILESTEKQQFSLGRRIWATTPDQAAVA